MRALPWLGPWRSLQGWLASPPSRQATAPAAWQAAAAHRRRLLLAALIALAGLAAVLGHDAGLQPAWALVLATVLFTWVGLGLITALMGSWVLLRGDRHALTLRQPRAPIPVAARTAIVMPICNEDVGSAFACLRATCESLAASGALSLFDVYVLSDTADPTLRAAELAAWQQLRDSLGDSPDAPGGRLFYRVRRHRSERKAGNVADFCRRWGRRYRYLVVLDADSTMDGDTLLGLVRLMEQHPRAGIVQTLPQPLGPATLHARAQQFGARLTGRLFALGMAYWQLGDSHYWGHNAILRVAPFMAHCRIAPLPGRGGLSGSILSHDFVEAALMCRAGYEVWLAPQLTGSWEQTPPNLIDELQRDRRWCQGNLQNARLITEPGWRGAHRSMFVTGALSYAVAPLWLALAATGLMATSASGPTPTTAAAGWLWGLTIALLLLPRALGLAALIGRGEQAALGGTARVLVSTVLEMALSAMQAPLRMLAHSAYVLGGLTGLRIEWRSPPRDARAVGWVDAWQRIGVLTVLPLALAAILFARADAPPWPLLPLLLPMLLALPFAVATGSERLGHAARRLGLLSVPEELAPPRPVTRAAQVRDLAPWRPNPPTPAPAATAAWAWPRLAYGASLCALVVAGLAPRTALGPDPQPDSWMSASRLAWLAPSAQSEASDDEGDVSSAPRTAMRRALPSRPARYIDDAVRRRAAEAVARALAEG